MTKYVAYYRVSTNYQRRSGLGLEAQAKTVREQIGGEPIMAFTEAESGRKMKRPELTKALDACKETGATLIVARLDRLTRNIRFLIQVLDAKVPVMFCDLPQIPNGHMGIFMLTIMVAVAQLESGMIGDRTKAAWGALKDRGADLRKNTVKASAAKTHRARQRARALAPEIAAIRENGITSLKGIAGELTERTGKKWHPTSVARVLDRLAA